MKGFMHIVEIIIVVLAMFVILVQLVGTPGIDTDWSRVSLSMKADDLLHSLEASGVDWFNSGQVSAAIKSTLNMSNIIYSVKLANVIKPDIRVGCICFNSGELDEVRNALQNPSFSINGQSPSFSVENITTDDLPFTYDAIIVMDRNISYTNAYKYLANGGGLIEVRDLSLELAGPKENYGDEGKIHQLLFGLGYLHDIPVPSITGAITFNPQATFPNTTYYNVYNYFAHIPNGTGMKINETHYFSNFLGCNDPEHGECEKMQTTLPSARALMNQSGTGLPALIVNSAVAENKGRTAWLSGLPSGKHLTDDDMDDMTVLIKSLVIWASGEEYDVLPSISMVSPMKATMYKVYNMDMMQPVEITLSMGSVY